MTTPARLRPAEVNDLPFIFSKELEYMETIEPDGLEGWMSAIELNLADWIGCLPRTVFVVDDDGRPLGYAMWTLQDDSATLVSIHVLGSHRRQGLGRLLLEAFEQGATPSGVRVVKLGVHRSNPARRLYTAAGYETTGQDGDYVLFSKVLNES
ncbi:GNAT family N-acetyltransferase [Arthrobacter sunyaminii]|uniref:GNAT family N-acetyltransferase n=1 Tax=Arthrobacter sunyaminii TaxID=2816859 RepID=A0A975S5C0_9MICC|nr:GNAT family N-acetyltransferase [Arthrobacter sunyaminii]MBO0909557.1 GNAT family N-acetyltransferase [Arthrobacter sunyaminii]QWQ36133.1 GNAT family N-acetyltransferase [Arthrobacter sunyaminii]